ncbi:hypothetical protein ACT3S7_15305 [Corynebacterium sp. AOP34-AQ2-28]|uniref:hypothetical protein n=1 Tax=Corynebacterium sp. AOP34-AQ2-28 TaxID=3457689 RepID=UPI00403477C7
MPPTQRRLTITSNDKTNNNVKVLVQNIQHLPHGYQILGVALIGAAVAMAAYGLSEMGMLDVAATFATCFVLTFGRLAFSFKTPNEGSDFKETRTFINNLVAEYKEFTRTRAVLGKALIALMSALLFIALRWIMIAAMGFLANPWLAAALGALVASAIASPILWRAMGGSLTEKVDKTDA